MVQSYMAHHQGMGLCALTNCLCGDSIRRRFMALPEIRAVEILLEEKPPAHGIVIGNLKAALRKGPGKKTSPAPPGDRAQSSAGNTAAFQWGLYPFSHG